MEHLEQIDGYPYTPRELLKMAVESKYYTLFYSAAFAGALYDTCLGLESLQQGRFDNAIWNAIHAATEYGVSLGLAATQHYIHANVEINSLTPKQAVDEGSNLFPEQAFFLEHKA